MRGPVCVSSIAAGGIYLSSPTVGENDAAVTGRPHVTRVCQQFCIEVPCRLVLHHVNPGICHDCPPVPLNLSVNSGKIDSRRQLFEFPKSIARKELFIELGLS